MIWDLITGFLPDVLPWILGALGIGAAYLTGRSGGAAKAKQRQSEARADAVIRGAEGAADAARQINAGKTPQQIKDDNDARW